MCFGTLRTGLNLFQDYWFSMGHMARFTLKSEHFPIYLLRNPRFVCWKPQNSAPIFWDDCFEGSHAYFYTEKWSFYSAMSLRYTRDVCWNPHNRVCFSETINLRGHMPRFTLKVNIFPSISWETPDMCVETLRTMFIFPKKIGLKGHMPMV